MTFPLLLTGKIKHFPHYVWRVYLSEMLLILTYFMIVSITKHLRTPLALFQIVKNQLLATKAIYTQKILLSILLLKI